jgi:UDPglucose--hexose-1-phosphate uridylyltransferase
MPSLFSNPHRRFNPLTGEWILVSPHRTKRPWQGKTEEAGREAMPAHDPACYLCPGNERAVGMKNPQYDGVYVFDNDFAALLPEIPPGNINENGLIIAESERGICRVVCFSPRHDLTLARMEKDDIKKVIAAWIDQYKQLGAMPDINYVQIFENRGPVMGCSNPHPHGQIWADEKIPLYPAIEQEYQREHTQQKGSCLLCDYCAMEIDRKERVVFENRTFAAIVPFWAFWPFEILLLPKQHITDIACMDDSQQNDLADAMKRLSIRYDNLFKTSFPYSMGFHQRPTDGQPHDEWHFHLHYYPPLLRSATVKKFMVGYEMLAMPQRDITAEESARRLRDECGEIHYLSTK